jgi:hypothetical protein
MRINKIDGATNKKVISLFLPTALVCIYCKIILSIYHYYISLATLIIHYESRQSSWHVLSKKWSATIHVKHYHVHHHELYDAALCAERTWQLHEFEGRRQKFNAVIILRARRKGSMTCAIH